MALASKKNKEASVNCRTCKYCENFIDYAEGHTWSCAVNKWQLDTTPGSGEMMMDRSFLDSGCGEYEEKKEPIVPHSGLSAEEWDKYLETIDFNDRDTAIMNGVDLSVYYRDAAGDWVERGNLKKEKTLCSKHLW